ncbi:hypothetical protein OH77DRAFT_501251 [Trametes cingulata]|nr:hypothetical protein OH77DRAFT_501251 [Trametes cingulata]
MMIVRTDLQHHDIHTSSHYRRPTTWRAQRDAACTTQQASHPRSLPRHSAAECLAPRASILVYRSSLGPATSPSRAFKHALLDVCTAISSPFPRSVSSRHAVFRAVTRCAALSRQRTRSASFFTGEHPAQIAITPSYGIALGLLRFADFTLEISSARQGEISSSRVSPLRLGGLISRDVR